MDKTLAIQTRNLTKHYGTSRGIENLNLDVKKGEIFGFLGPNGAGKTTTIRLLLDLIRATSGEAFVLGHSVQNESKLIREQVAYLPGELGTFKDWTAKRTLAYLFKLYDKPVKWAIVEDLAQALNLDLKKKTRELSKGNKQKIGIISVLAPDVELLILDEPTSGLDPLVNNEFYKLLIEKQVASGCTVFLSSHQLQEVEKIAHRVGIIRQGLLIEIAVVAQLKQLALKHVDLSLASPSSPTMFEDKLPQQAFNNLILEKSSARFSINRGELALLLPKLKDIPFNDINIGDSTLEDIFLEYYTVANKGQTCKDKENEFCPNSKNGKRGRFK